MSAHADFADFRNEILGRLGTIDQKIVDVSKPNGKRTPNWVYLAPVIFSVLASVFSAGAWMRGTEIKATTQMILEVRQDMKEMNTRIWGHGGIREEQLGNSSWIAAQKAASLR